MVRFLRRKKRAISDIAKSEIATLPHFFVLKEDFLVDTFLKLTLFVFALEGV
jgi:hypothetical protein